ncbi:MAG TPA: hypothetical protein VMH24_07580 [Candidatus Sulfotelmatobacter sp.]|nr:hypothetical protein [Candidatus Sulfotelmatobacter sp.]
MTRRRSPAGALLVALAAAGCALGPPAVATGPGPSPPGFASATAGASPAGPPPMLLAAPTGLFVTAAGAPLARSSVATPPGDGGATIAVGPGGSVLLVSGAGAGRPVATAASLVRDRLAVRWSVALTAGAGATPLAGCIDAAGQAIVIADRLIDLVDGRVAGTHEVPATAGRCQFTVDGAVAYLADVDHAVTAWRPPDGGAVVTATRCDDVGLGGGRLACLSGDGHIAVGRAGPWLAGGPAFDERAAQSWPGPARQVVISADGTWLAIVARDGSAVALYHRTGSAYGTAGGFDLPAGTVLLGFVGP